MSIFKCKDIDIIFLCQLDETDCINLCSTNKYYYNLYHSNLFWYHKLIKKYKLSNFTLNYLHNREGYKSLYLKTIEKDFVRNLYESLRNGEETIVALLFDVYKIDPSYTLCLQSELWHSTNGIMKLITYFAKKSRENIDPVVSYHSILQLSMNHLNIFKIVVYYYEISNYLLLPNILSDILISENLEVLEYFLKDDKFEYIREITYDNISFVYHNKLPKFLDLLCAYIFENLNEKNKDFLLKFYKTTLVYSTNSPSYIEVNNILRKYICLLKN
jgi:hypothetical protein